MEEQKIINRIIEILNGKPYIVNWRKKGEFKIDECFFCGKKHEHGLGEGHRVAHCLPKDVDSFYEFEGTKITFQSGYIVREY
jgi:hypothetical protein